MTNEERGELIAGQARLEGKIETLTARLEAHLDRTSAEIKTLFGARGEHAEKIEAIRVDYVPKRDFEQHKRHNREEHEAFMKGLSCVQWKVAKIAGGISLLAFIAGLVVKSVGAF